MSAAEDFEPVDEMSAAEATSMKLFGGYRLTAQCDTCPAYDTAWLVADVHPQQLGSVIKALAAGWAQIHSGHEQMVIASYAQLMIGPAA